MSKIGSFSSKTENFITGIHQYLNAKDKYIEQLLEEKRATTERYRKFEAENALLRIGNEELQQEVDVLKTELDQHLQPPIEKEINDGTNEAFEEEYSKAMNNDDVAGSAPFTFDQYAEIDRIVKFHQPDMHAFIKGIAMWMVEDSEEEANEEFEELYNLITKSHKERNYN